MTPAPRRRTGFTLVELLVVITILGILIALLTPAVFSAVRRANDARVASEINIIGQALASFRSKYSEYPPSRIILVESGAYNTASPPAAFYGVSGPAMMAYAQGYANIGDGSAAAPDFDVSYATLSQRSITALRKFFPKVQVTTGTSAPGVTPSNYYDFNGNQQLDQYPILLEGHECLVFFLGGIPNHDIVGSIATLNGMSGFSANPRNPFQRRQGADATPRNGPYFDFAADRLVDDDLDGIPGYVDSMGKQGEARYFAYFSAYEGSGYDPNDVNLNGTAIGEPSSIGRQFLLSFPLNAANRATTSPLPNPYTSSLPVPSSSGAAAFQNAQSYQVIAAGRDRRYGAGGQYTSASNESRLPVTPAAQYSGDSRVLERDNITNFSNGTLD